MEQTRTNNSPQLTKLLNNNEQNVKTFLEFLIKSLGVETAKVEFVENEYKRKEFRIRAAPEDRGKLMGFGGQNHNAMHTLVKAYGAIRGVRFSAIRVED
jgi:predicted RNA-binding protein YlqC (UPF0109 family)